MIGVFLLFMLSGSLSWETKQMVMKKIFPIACCTIHFCHSLGIKMTSLLTFVWIRDGGQKVPASSEHHLSAPVEDHINYAERTLTVFQKDIPCSPSYITSPCTTILTIQRCIKIKFTGPSEMVTHLSPNLMIWVIFPLTYRDRTALPSYPDFHMGQHGIHIHTHNKYMLQNVFKRKQNFFDT